MEESRKETTTALEMAERGLIKQQETVEIVITNLRRNVLSHDARTLNARMLRASRLKDRGPRLLPSDPPGMLIARVRLSP